MILLLLIAFNIILCGDGFCNKIANYQHFRFSALKMASNVIVYETPTVVGEALCKNIIDAAKREILNKDKFYLCIPGGSAVKLLKGLRQYKQEIDWSKVILFYVNHKYVSETDESATHFKARNLFLDYVESTRVFVPDSTKASAIETAQSYAIELDKTLPKLNNLPYFDLVVLGMGKDGHIGSLYPGRNEINNIKDLCVAVDKKSPPSVSITLPVFNNAKEILCVVTGEDKTEAVTTAIKKLKTPQDFPVCGVRSEGTTWLIDKSCASLLDGYVSA